MLKQWEPKRWSLALIEVNSGERHTLTIWGNQLPELHLALHGQPATLNNIANAQVVITIGMTPMKNGRRFNKVTLFARPRHLADPELVRQRAAAREFEAEQKKVQPLGFDEVCDLQEASALASVEVWVTNTLVKDAGRKLWLPRAFRRYLKDTNGTATPEQFSACVSERYPIEGDRILGAHFDLGF